MAICLNELATARAVEGTSSQRRCRSSAHVQAPATIRASVAATTIRAAATRERTSAWMASTAGASAKAIMSARKSGTKKGAPKCSRKIDAMTASTIFAFSPFMRHFRRLGHDKAVGAGRRAL